MATRSLWLIAATVAAVALAGLAGFGWYEAVQRGNAKSTVEVALNVEKQQRQALQQQIDALQRDLAKARESEQALRSQKLDVQASLSASAMQTNEADALKQRAEKAEQAQAAAEGRVKELEAAVAQAKAQAAAATPGSRTAETAKLNASPALPTPNLPPGAISRDYLVAAQQAIRGDNPGLARAALGRAEVRLLNRLSGAGKVPPLGKHPGVSEIEQVLDLLQNDKQAALNALDALLKRDSAAD